MNDAPTTTADGNATALDMLSELRAIRVLLAATRPPGELLDKSELAVLAALGESTVDRLRSTGVFGPADVRVGGSLRWRRAEVLAWIAHPRPDGELMDRETWKAFWVEWQKRMGRK